MNFISYRLLLLTNRMKQRSRFAPKAYNINCPRYFRVHAYLLKSSYELMLGYIIGLLVLMSTTPTVTHSSPCDNLDCSRPSIVPVISNRLNISSTAGICCAIILNCGYAASPTSLTIRPITDSSILPVANMPAVLMLCGSALSYAAR